ncbi:hypothetical protein AAG570_011750 [Ranatra chinensis]|uniref:Uncharacterized protein n=1 Tax=Ranatra chinensis TaxID=642074 RepID=A0ABD0YGX1_9HEMI
MRQGRGKRVVFEGCLNECGRHDLTERRWDKYWLSNEALYLLVLKIVVGVGAMRGNTSAAPLVRHRPELGCPGSWGVGRGRWRWRWRRVCASRVRAVPYPGVLTLRGTGSQ